MAVVIPRKRKARQEEIESVNEPEHVMSRKRVRIEEATASSDAVMMKKRTSRDAARDLDEADSLEAQLYASALEQYEALGLAASFPAYSTAERAEKQSAKLYPLS